MRSVLVSVFSTAVAVLGIALLPTPPAGAATEQVSAGSNYFCAPSSQNGVCTTSITAGDTVTWTMVAGIHTVTECDATYSACPVPGGFDSGILQASETFSQTFDTAGEYAYYCRIHPIEMRGVISVVAAATDTPAPTPTPEATSAASPTASPAAVPNTGGGEPTEDGLPLTVLALALGAALAVAGTGSLYAARRR